ncbi:hypothetical protein GAS19_15620 [Burkholderia glumae]|nr:hypothetical protein CEQ24_027695 [Burkholderia glumae]QGA38915.1 hypothetical protein GAS19_15620 [Burkholderia glumae]QHP91659.1 hypothetical protein EXE55_12390 [Burkholderia glumae]UVS91861.1 hypothetical protein EFP17_04910 [Burkholderia glumae]UVT05254.1 hypothetical protein EFP20_02820 [Burkholderia glumae]
MTPLRVGLFRQISCFHRHAEFVLAHGVPASKVDRRPGGTPHGPPGGPLWSAFCLMPPAPATARQPAPPAAVEWRLRINARPPLPT